MGGRHLGQLADEGGRWWCGPAQHPVAEGVGHPGVDGRRHGQAHAGHVRLGQLGAAVIGAHVAVHVEHPAGLGVGGYVAPGQRRHQLVGPAGAGQALEAPAQRLDLRRPVEAEQAADVDGVEAGQPLGSGLAHQRGEHHGQHQGAKAVEGGLGLVVDLLSTGHQSGGRQRGQDQQRPGHGQRRSLADHRRGLGQLASARRLPLFVARGGAGQWRQLPCVAAGVVRS